MVVEIAKNKKYLIILFLIIFIYFVSFSVMSILKHYTFHSTALDLSTFHYELDHISKGEFHYVNEIMGVKLFADHFYPINFLFIPFYWIWPHVETLLVIQSFFLGLGALPLYLLSRKKLKNEIIALIISSIYLLYVPLEAINLIDFHSNVIAIPFLLFAFYFLEDNKYGYFTLFSILAIMCREEITLIIFMMGIYMILKKNIKIGLITAGLALIYFVLIVGFLMPSFAEKKIGSADFLENRYVYLGHSYKEISETLITKPFYVLEHVFTLPKIKYLFLLFFSVGFGIFSIFAPEILMISLPIFAINLLSEFELMYQIYYQYNAGIIPFIFISTIYGIPRFIRFFNNKLKKVDYKKLLWIAVVFIFSTSLLFSYLEGPLPFSRVFSFRVYDVDSEFVNTGHELIKSIPKDSSVLAPVNVFPHLMGYKKVYMHPGPYPQYSELVGINKNTSIDYIIMFEFDDPYDLYKLKKLLPMDDYEEIKNENGWLLFKK
ncbi:MAG: DUF2079 domain-containing protein [Nanoarchaeota archaeon]|nr:DUF2079 domain-containing protein [Nanoarchaeota archaeon]